MPVVASLIAQKRRVKDKNVWRIGGKCKQLHLKCRWMHQVYRTEKFKDVFVQG
jgi:hypothetical protein